MSGDTGRKLHLATQFWSETRSSPMLAALLTMGVSEAAQDFGDEDQTQFVESIDRWIADMGYGLPLSDMLVLRDAVRDGQLAYWKDVYLVKYGEDETFQLWVRGDDASTVVDGIPLAGDTLGARRLELTGDGGASLTLTFSEDDPQPGNPGKVPVVATCAGTLTLPGQVAVDVKGKQGCFFRNSIDWKRLGDPLAAWAGTFPLVDAESGEDTDSVLAVTVDGTVSLDGKPLKLAFYSNNALIADAMDGTQVKARFSTGLCYVALHANQTWSFYAARRQAAGARRDSPSVAPVMPHAAMAATSPATSATTVGNYPDVPYLFDVAANAPSVRLPEAVEKHPYAIQLSYNGQGITHCTLAEPSKPYPDNVQVSPTGLVEGVFGETQNAAFQKFQLDFKGADCGAHSLQVEIPVSSRRDINLSPGELKPMTKGVSYSQTLAIDGFVDNVFWRIDSELDQDKTGLALKFTSKSGDIVYGGRVHEATRATLEGNPKSSIGSASSFTVTVYPDPAKTIQTPTVKTYTMDVVDPVSFDRGTGIFGMITSVLGIAEFGFAIYAVVQSRKPSDVDKLTHELHQMVLDTTTTKDLRSKVAQLTSKLDTINQDISEAETARAELVDDQAKLKADIDAAKRELKDAKTKVERATAEQKVEIVEHQMAEKGERRKRAEHAAARGERVRDAAPKRKETK